MKLIAKGRHSATGTARRGNNGRTTLPPTAATPSLQENLPFWRNLEIISQYQRGTLENWGSLWTNWLKGTQLAPDNLWQNINPWSFSCIQFTKEIRGTPALECKILKEVAGYGSQIGTILDLLEVFAKKCEVQIGSLPDEEDIAKLVKFQDLVARIDRAKASAP